MIHSVLSCRILLPQVLDSFLLIYRYSLIPLSSVCCFKCDRLLRTPKILRLWICYEVYWFRQKTLHVHRNCVLSRFCVLYSVVMLISGFVHVIAIKTP